MRVQVPAHVHGCTRAPDGRLQLRVVERVTLIVALAHAVEQVAALASRRHRRKRRFHLLAIPAIRRFHQQHDVFVSVC